MKAKLRTALALLVALLAAGAAEARSSHSYGGRSHHSSGLTSHSYAYSNSGGSHRSSTRSVPGVSRDSHGRVERSESAKRAFEKQTGYSHGRPGYVVDHVVPLARGGADSPSNMQWQTKAEAKAKDRVELGRTPRAQEHKRSRHK